MAGFRKERLEHEMRKVIAEAFLREIKDPRIGFITVTSVKLNKDLTIADVGISVMGDEKEKKLTLAGAESAAGYIQRLVGKAIKLRVTPKIRFFLDTSIEEGVRMVNIIEDLKKDS
ncbi:MAG: 30S ribosome-binding factor RbfA [Spirochaetes bacterium]|nr:30S ribosome-binding factor RbfA [Spirochaetota bacterium]